jgi:hypothetical protein
LLEGSFKLIYKDGPPSSSREQVRLTDETRARLKERLGDDDEAAN